MHLSVCLSGCVTPKIIVPIDLIFLHIQSIIPVPLEDDPDRDLE